jgi:Ca2+-binding RTX toxin-like protein
MQFPGALLLRSRYGAPFAFLVALLTLLGIVVESHAAVGPGACAAGPTSRHHVTKGTACADVIVTRRSVRKVYGGGGNDTIYAPASVNVVYGGGGRDTIYVSPYGVTAKGGKGDDVIVAQLPPVIGDARTASRSTATTSTDCPTGCYLGAGGQTFNGGNGTDIVYGQRNNDTLNGGGGNDLLYGGVGDDNVYGGTGNDLLSGGWGADDVDGQAGNDLVRGDGTIDTIEDTGGGNDTISYATGVTPGFPDDPSYPSFSSVRNFPTYDGERGLYLNLSSSVSDNSVARYGGSVDTIRGADFENVIGTAFSDYIVGNNSNNAIWGGGGGDVILGGGANDSLLGGADGDHLDGGSGYNGLYGNAGADYCRSYYTTNTCEPTVNTGGVVLRDPTRISVGVMASELGAYGQLYLTGSNAADSVSATYKAGPPVSVTFTVASGSAGLFDQSAAAAGGCQIPSPTQAVCSLGSGKRLESIVVAGMGGDDTLAANGFPTWATVVGAGGEGNDSVSGGNLSEDILVDGPDATGAGNDVLNGFGGDDALLNNGGADQLFAGDGNDLFLSTAICNGDLLNGGADSDNASWAKFKDTGIEARLAEGVAGRPGTGAAPDCGAGPFDGLQQIEALEGSSQGDALYGDAGPNSLLGRAGGDVYYAREGDDKITANAADLDPIIDCGTGADTAVVDYSSYGDRPNANCETVSQAGSSYSG